MVGSSPICSVTSLESNRSVSYDSNVMPPALTGRCATVRLKLTTTDVADYESRRRAYARPASRQPVLPCSRNPVHTATRQSRTMSDPLSLELGRWVCRTTFDDLPADVVEATKNRVLDVIGLSLAGAETAFGRSVLDAATRACRRPVRAGCSARAMRLGVTMAAFVNGAWSQALEYDDTHNESIVHMSSPSVAAALALAEYCAAVRLKPDYVRRKPDAVRGPDVGPATAGPCAGVSGFSRTVGPVSGRDLIAAIAIGNEISCRVGSVAPGQFHRLGFHPSGLFAPFGVTYLAGKLLGLDADALARAAGICGSFAAGILECWVDGTQPKFLHPGMGRAKRHHVGVSGTRRDDRPGRRLRRTLRFVRVAPPGSARGAEFRPDHAGARHALGFAPGLVQAVSGRARAASVPRRPAAIARPARHHARRCRADRLSGGGLHRADCVRAGRREDGTRVGLARPRQPAVHAGRGVGARRARQDRVSRRQPDESGDPRAGAPRALHGRSRLSRAPATSKAKCGSRSRMAGRSSRWRNSIADRSRIR